MGSPSATTRALLIGAGFTDSEIDRIFTPPPGGSWPPCLVSVKMPDGEWMHAPAKKHRDARTRGQRGPKSPLDGREDEFRELWASGVPAPEVAERFGVGDARPYAWARRLGISRRRKAAA